MAKYHMKNADREIHNKDEIKRILKSGKYAVLAMCRNNEPYIVTLSCGYDEANNALYFHSALTGVKMDFIRDNPEVCATVIEDRGYKTAECEHAYGSVVIRGRMYALEALEEKKHAMNVLIDHLEPNPEPIKARLLKKDSIYEGFAMLKLEINEITAKQGS